MRNKHRIVGLAGSRNRRLMVAVALMAPLASLGTRA
jgi:hypothetical protein